MTGPSMFLAR